MLGSDCLFSHKLVAPESSPWYQMNWREGSPSFHSTPAVRPSLAVTALYVEHSEHQNVPLLLESPQTTQPRHLPQPTKGPECASGLSPFLSNHNRPVLCPLTFQPLSCLLDLYPASIPHLDSSSPSFGPFRPQPKCHLLRVALPDHLIQRGPFPAGFFSL